MGGRSLSPLPLTLEAFPCGTGIRRAGHIFCLETGVEEAATNRCAKIEEHFLQHLKSPGMLAGVGCGEGIAKSVQQGWSTSTGRPAGQRG